MPLPALGECGADKRRIGDACPTYREGCNGRENSPPLVEAFPSLAKVGIGGRKATRRRSANFIRGLYDNAHLVISAKRGF